MRSDAGAATRSAARNSDPVDTATASTVAQVVFVTNSWLVMMSPAQPADREYNATRLPADLFKHSLALHRRWPHLHALWM